MKMKTIIIAVSLMLSVVAVSGCESSSGSQGPNDSKKPAIEDNENKNDNKDNTDNKELKVSSYYPIKKNVTYVYEGSGNEYASYDVYTSYTDENKVQYRVDNGGTVSANIIEIKDGEIIQLSSRPEVYYQENLLRSSVLDNIDKKEHEILLKEPIKVGNFWELKNGMKREITDTKARVKTPYGDFDAIEVTTTGLDVTSEEKQDSKSIDYYVKDLGLVKSVYISEGMEITSTLKEIKEDAKLTQNIKFFYPDIDDERLHYKDEEVEFKTDDIAKMTLEKAYKNTLKYVNSVVLTENTKINYLYLNDDGMVYLDLSKEFLSEMNAGSGYESKILESLAATFGSYYGVDKVVLTIDGGDYESGHIVLSDGDYIEFNTENVVHKK